MNSKKYFQNLKSKLRPQKIYLYNLKNYIIFAIFFFVFAFAYGYGLAQNSPGETQGIINDLKNTYTPIMEASPFGQFVLIFLNNALVGFLSIILSVVVGLFPLLALFSNGMILGLLAYFSFSQFSVPIFLISILPHGIIELPVMLIFIAAGLRIGHTVYYLILKKLFPKNIKLIARNVDVRKEINLAMRLFVKVLLPLLLLAALIETFITASLL